MVTLNPQAHQLATSTLRRRVSLLADAREIKRLQHAYGYYLDQGSWDDAAELFAPNGRIEAGLDGVYVGRDRVREYLRGVGGEHQPAGELREHMQVMPVVTVAPDGVRACGHWRGILMQGRFGHGAFWGEGEYDVEYVKLDGAWQIQNLQWFHSMLVPYQGGWAEHADVVGGKYAPAELAPDAPPSIEYGTWPTVFHSPLRFDNRSIATATPRHDGGPASGTQPPGELTHVVGLLEDEYEIENLQRIYGYYVEKGLWTEAASLFTVNGTLEVAGRGVYEGQDRVLEYLRSIDDEYPQDGRLYERMQLQPIVRVALDRHTATARWRLFAQGARHGEFAEWGVGWYENDYIKEDGVWKLRNLRIFPWMYTPYEDGWARTALPGPSYSSTLEPDRASTVDHALYPHARPPTFSYERQPAGSNAGVGGDGGDVGDGGIDSAALASLEQRITRLEDLAAVERLHAAYGYYLARNQWDDLADLFADDGTIEIAQRGVYVGKPSVRRNLDLYGEQGLHHARQHNHMQFQPVIHISPDGSRAHMRSRGFSIMGPYGGTGRWMGGVYENEFVKHDGVWKIQQDQVFNTYFINYEIGWKDAPQTPPPGISDSNPPDLPPSVSFDMYPTAFLPPFHYNNPVTGRPPSMPE